QNSKVLILTFDLILLTSPKGLPAPFLRGENCDLSTGTVWGFCRSKLKSNFMALSEPSAKCLLKKFSVTKDTKSLIFFKRDCLIT
ncbi:hypothetical protein ACE1AT_03140, partial [Pelatocladus sp. BLCC-F211]|uniref:hypothetical protein n=1 Tax=Pelatocladus sp. BLCC-F211 TaxID=3342752 RepID=UPI0035BAC150